MYKYLPYALGRQKYVLELAVGICMLSAQRWLFAPPFVVLFPCKVNKRKCVVPENIHTPLPTEGNGNSEGKGGPKEGNFWGVRGCLQRFYPGGLSKIDELWINNYNSFSVEQAIIHVTVTPVLHWSSFIYMYGRLNAFFTANATVFFSTIVIGSWINFWFSSCGAVAILHISFTVI